jgi:L-ribulokinase
MTVSPVLGLDFGTASARAFLLDAATGAELGSADARYRSGTIDSALPSGRRLGAAWALQDPRDWLEAMTEAARGALAAAAVPPGSVQGVGIAFTSCTALPVLADGTPLSFLPEWEDEPHAWAKLWKHHAAQRQADELTALARDGGEAWLARYGGRVSSEWLIPKVVQIADECPAVLDAADLVVEAADWIVWQLTGRLVRNACAAGFKGLWHKEQGYPSPAFMAALRPALEGFHDAQGRGEVAAPGAAAGTLAPRWAEALGGSERTAVAVGTIDAHAGVIGAGVTRPGTLYMALGTSTCHLILAEREHLVEGIAGVVEDGIVAGLFGYEAGQAAAGDVLDWCAARAGMTHAELVAQASRLAPGEHGLLALDWWNGCRTPLADSDLTGAVLGWSLSSTLVDLYRALIEATAFGTRLIVESFASSGLAVDAIRVGGGLTLNPLLLQVYADVLGLPIAVQAGGSPTARGAALLGAAVTGRYGSVGEAAQTLAPAPDRTVVPDAAAAPIYDRLYEIYRDLVDRLGRDDASPLRRLARVRDDAAAAHPATTPNERRP